ncbi:hypothetical protein BDW02DRAFT_377979 [Decorospora gaudefroyi]|uniref:USP domain-containing protein n=1 Tax=Decorospora gaudefroyi TaxID=184978 RepID=A0A6A5KBB3_9PLEO|nr:hypothetical protein BDW02DRAFT_377979 [Decorospora gaudefroyi]
MTSQHDLVPASPPRRDSIEDGDASFTRKRPRLHSGSNSLRAMSPEPKTPENAAALPPETPVEMTIRSHPPSSPVPAGDDAHGNANDTLEHPQDQSPVLVADSEDEAGSPPVMVIDDDDDDDVVGYAVRMDADDYFRRFPYAQMSSYSTVVRDLMLHVQSPDTEVDFDFFTGLTRWLADLPDPSMDLQGFYASKIVFWDDMSLLVNKVLLRRASFGRHYENLRTGDIVYGFLSAYVRLCSFLLLADVHLLSRPRPDDIYLLPLLSHKHMRHLHTVLRPDKTPAFHMLNKEYSVDLRLMIHRLQKDFLAANGAQNLLRLAHDAIHHVPMTLQNHLALWAAPILSSLGTTLFQTPFEDIDYDRPEYFRGVLLFLEKYMDDLFNLGRTTDSETARELIHYFYGLLFELCFWDKKIESDLVDRFLDVRSSESPATSSSTEVIRNINPNDYCREPEAFPALVANAWKFKLLRKYLTKGKMNLRVMSIAMMDAGLLELWKHYNDRDPPAMHPVLQYLADFLMKGKVVDYIISVDSHPQLITRSGNIVGFLVVTHRWSDSTADAVWNTVASNPDPRVVTATMAMLRQIVPLMRPSDHLYLCTKLYETPIASYTMEILRFLREISTRLMEMVSSADWVSHEFSARPWNVCIRMICDTFPQGGTDKDMLDLHNEAIDHLKSLAPRIQDDERRTIYLDCAAHISSHLPKATGSVKVLWTLGSVDGLFFQENQDIITEILGEIPWLVRTKKSTEASPYQMLALRYRLELLALIICHGAPAMPAELYEALWDHTVGLHALSNNARDLAWAQLLQTIKFAPENDYCKQLVSSYVPQMAPRLYTPAMLDFIANYNFPKTRELVATKQGEESVLHIPGADVLWSMALSSPEVIIQDRAARLLAARYTEVNEHDGVTLEDVEIAHVVLVEKCLQEMQSACETVREASASDMDPENMDAELLDQAIREHEGRCRRIIFFQKLLLDKIRQKPEFNRGRRNDSKVEQPNVPYGDAIAIRYQCGNERQVVTMAAEHTVDDLYRRLCHASGYSKINLFAKGHRLNVIDQANKKISDVDFGGQLLVQRAPEAEVTRPLSGVITGSSVFESTVVKYFDQLFSLMDSEDTMSQLLFDYLTFFPARNSFADGVMTGDARTDDLFPPGKFYQARYAALALQSRLREQIRNSNLNDEFLSNAIYHLDEALLDPRVIADTISSFQELQLAAVLVNVLLEFLRERPSPDTSVNYFSDGGRLADRFVTILSVALETGEEASVIEDCYGVILEASLHSRAIWEAFVKNPDMPRLHQILLLHSGRPAIREQIARKIASVCGGDLPSTCPLTKGEIATRFWKVISAILPDSIRHPRQSQQLFGIAEHVFRAKDEYERTEESLRSCLTQWSDLLLNHKHQEFVGRDETDHVVLGFTKLLLYCILSLKSFKKPLNTGNLMEQIFKKYIFTKSTSSAEAGLATIPVLETHTRHELYDLMLALVDDCGTYNTLLQLAEEVETEESGPVLATISVDRSMEIRSGTGYVGLYNPRAICYANSLLTQLFMNLNFRKFILDLQLQEATGSQKLLLETQRLFTHMQHSFRKSTDPRDFAACVKNSDFMPIDISIQMDADEFFNSLFDQWERQLIKDEQKQRFRSFYGGQTLNQIKSMECEHVSERVEPFFAVQCDVQGKSTLQESLQAFVRGDVMEGDNKYKCESCGGKYVDAVKRTCFKDVPDNLIFHLKRFEFDLENFSRRKVYDHFEFPSSIDMSAYHVDHLGDSGQPQKEDIFDLVGVLVHTGTCEHGHYYSYIRERPCPTGNATPTWVEFDDSNVGPFDPMDIAYRAFGGFTEETAYHRVPKQYSAYMLFYQRRAAVDEDQQQWVTRTDGQTLKVPMPKDLEKEVDINNELLIREYCLFDSNHTKFLRQLHVMSRTINHGSCSEEHSQETHSLHTVLTHLGHIVWRHTTPDIFAETLLQLRRSVLPCSICCSIVLRFLASDESALLNTLLRCPHSKVRSQIRSFFIDCLKVLREKEPALYGSECTDNEMDLDSSAPLEGILTAVIVRLRQIVDESYLSIRGWDDLYLTLTQIADMGHAETAVLLDRGFLSFCFQLFSMHVHKQFQDDYPELWRILSKRIGIYNRLIGFVSALLSRMDTGLPPVPLGQSDDRQATLDRESMKFPLTNRERQLLFYWNHDLKAIAVLDKVLEMFDQSKVDNFYPGHMVRSLLEWPDVQAQINLFKTIVDGIALLDPPLCDAYIRAGLSFCEASPVVENVTRVVNTVAKEFASQKRTEEERSPGGIAVLQFFAGLVRAENEAVFQQKHRYVFFSWAMLKARVYAIPLLFHPLDSVRQGAHEFLRDLYTSQGWPRDTMQVKWKTLRDLVEEMINRIIYEKDAGMLRSHMNPLIATFHVLIGQLFDLTQSEDPDMDQYKDDINDAARIYQWQNEIEPRLATWAQDDGLSTGDLYESEFGSESDVEEIHEIEA